MTSAHVIYQLARADFFERIRRYSFVVTLVATVIAAYIFVPPNHAGYTTLDLGGHRGVYNSAWIGAQVALLTATFLALIGFYLVRNAVGRDRLTGVGQIIAGTPVSKPVYTLGKWLSNCFVLGLIVAVVIMGAAILQLIRGEDMAIRPIALVTPFLYLMIPTIALVAAIAVLFECIAFLSGALGNIIYFFVFPQLLMTEMLGGPKLLGVSYVVKEMQTTCRIAYPDYVNALSLGVNFHGGRSQTLATFVWNGMPLSVEFLLNRVLWFAVAVGIAAVAAIPFNRFDSAARKASRRKARPPRFARLRKLFERQAAWSPANSGIAAPSGSSAGHLHLTPLARGEFRFRFGGILIANLRLALRSMPWWWRIGALAAIVCEIFIPSQAVHMFVLPAALILPVMILASLGNREIHHATHQIVFSAPHPLRRQLFAAWLTCVTLMLLLVSGAGARWAIGGEWSRLVALLTGAAFAPSLALALGAWSRTSRLFEVIYLFWWYIGPVNAIPALDYAGTSAAAGALGITMLYAAAAVLLLVIGFLGARRQLAT